MCCRLARITYKFTITKFNTMIQIYKAVFDNETQASDYLFNIGVYVEIEDEGIIYIVYSENTASVVNIGKVVDPSSTIDPENPIYYPGFAYDIMSSAQLDFGSYEVYPEDNSVHSFYGWPRNAEVPPI